MTNTIERDTGGVRRRFGLLHLGMLACAIGVRDVDPHVCFATSAMGGARAEDDAAPASKPGAEPDGMCSACGMQNEDDAKFCDQCGKSMAAKKVLDEEPPPSSKEPESSKRAGAAAHPPPPDRMQAPAKMSADASIAAILGATGESPLALKTAAIEMRHQRDRLMSTLIGITGKDSLDGAIGAALNIPDKLAAGKRAASDLLKLKTATETAERWALAERLVATEKVKRTKVLADLHDAAGNRIATKDGRTVRIRSKYLNMDLGVFRGLVTDLEGDAPKKRRDPFEPDPARSADAARNGGADRQARLDAAKRSPAFVRMLRDPSNTYTEDQLAAALVDNAAAGGAL